MSSNLHGDLTVQENEPFDKLLVMLKPMISKNKTCLQYNDNA